MNWSKPTPVSDVDLAFPASVKSLLPDYASLPDDFRSRRNAWSDFVSSLFFKGGSLPNTKPGIDANVARRHIMACLGSFEPKHEHKIAGVAWLMSQWYEEPKGA